MSKDCTRIVANGDTDMNAVERVPMGLKIIIVFFGISAVLWIVGQGGAVIAYDHVAALGFHPERHLVDPVTVLVTQAIAVGDVVIQLPFFILAIIGLLRLRYFGAVAAWIGFGINLYWTTVAWVKQLYYLRTGVDTEPFGLALNGSLAFIFLFSAWASWYLFRKRMLFR